MHDSTPVPAAPADLAQITRHKQASHPCARSQDYEALSGRGVKCWVTLPADAAAEPVGQYPGSVRSVWFSFHRQDPLSLPPRTAGASWTPSLARQPGLTNFRSSPGSGCRRPSRVLIGNRALLLEHALQTPTELEIFMREQVSSMPTTSDLDQEAEACNPSRLDGHHSERCLGVVG